MVRVSGRKELFELDTRIKRIGKGYDLPCDGGKDCFESFSFYCFIFFNFQSLPSLQSFVQLLIA
jgi:hypothetical protein